ncbi:MAG: DNA primase [Nitrospiria bacterium]
MTTRRFSNQLIDRIRDQSDFVGIVSDHLSLKQTGHNYTGLCPFHQEKTPSFVVSPVKKVFHCFGCGAGGDLFHFVEKIEGISFGEVLEKLAVKAGVPLPSEKRLGKEGYVLSEREKVYDVNAAAADYFLENLLERTEGAQALQYLKKRGLTMDTIKTFQIGYAPAAWDGLLKRLGTDYTISILEKAGLVSRKASAPKSSQEKSACFDRFRARIMFPIKTRQGRTVGFGGRVLDDAMPKYLNTCETLVFTKGKQLFGLDHIQRGGEDPLIVVEGYLDAIAVHQAGIPNAVATLGTALTQDHLRLIRRVADRMVLIFDSDQAGERATLRAAPLLLEEGISASVVTLPQGKDPDTFIRTEGKDAFLNRVNRGKSLIDFSISRSLRKKDSQSIDDKLNIIHKIFPLIGCLRSPVQRSHYLNVLSDTLHIREKDIHADFVKWLKSGGQRQTREKASIASEKTLFQMKEQEGVLMLLLQGCLDPSSLNGKLDLEDFSDPMIHALMSHYWNAREAQWCNPGKELRPADEKSWALISRLSMMEFDREQVQRIGNDYLRTLSQKRIDRERRQLEEQLKGKEGKADPEALKRILELKKASSHLSVLH